MAKSIYMQITHCEKCSVELDWREEGGGLQLGAEGVDGGRAKYNGAKFACLCEIT